MEKTLDLAKPQDVKYVIPNWLRDEQVKLATARVTGRLQPAMEARPEAVAVVGFGPSLRETWEEIKGFKNVISCSGSHQFLIARGIIPKWHVAVDPLPKNTVQLIGSPHPDVEYLIASACHQDVFDHLEKFNVKLWHVFDGTEDGLRLLPPGEWAVTGGCDVGLRAMTIAAFLGFRNLHVFGMDGCARGVDDVRHAGDHPNGKQKYAKVEHEGKTYWTTPAMLAASQQTLHELEQMPGVRAKFYGEGLTQSLTKGYAATKGDISKPFANIIAFNKPILITDEYADLNRKLHREQLAYGVGGGKHAKAVINLAETFKTTSILDYGCGKGYLGKALPFPIWEYDPGVPGRQESPRAADIVVCTDVLEHIEPAQLGAVLGHIHHVTKKIAYLVIHTGKSSKKLADGRNAHLIQQPKEWWKNVLSKVFNLSEMIVKGPIIHVCVTPKSQAELTRKEVAKPAEPPAAQPLDLFAEAFTAPELIAA